MAAETAVDLLRRESGLLVQRLRLWTPTRWAAGTRAAVVLHLAQALADAAAAHEGEPVRALPALDSPLGLPDQLAVTADDAQRVVSDAAARGLVVHLLLHRSELLEDEVPAGLAGALGFTSGAALLAAARADCALA